MDLSHIGKSVHRSEELCELALNLIREEYNVRAALS